MATLDRLQSGRAISTKVAWALLVVVLAFAADAALVMWARMSVQSDAEDAARAGQAAIRSSEVNEDAAARAYRDAAAAISRGSTLLTGEYFRVSPNREVTVTTTRPTHSLLLVRMPWIDVEETVTYTVVQGRYGG